MFFLSTLLNASSAFLQDTEPYSSIRFKFGFSDISALYNYDYWLLLSRPFSATSTNKCSLCLFLVDDMSEENYGTSEGVLRVFTDAYPYNSYIPTVYTGIGFPVDYEQSVYYSSPSSFSYISGSTYTIQSSHKKTLSSSFNGLVFDNYNSDKFPVYEGASSTYTSWSVIASNVDIYNQYNVLVQKGNYHTLFQYFNGALDSTKITDYSGSEVAPGVTDSTLPSSSGGDSQTSKDQLETSKGIWGTVKDIFNSIASLPEKIANAISGFFDNLLNGIIEGLKFLFVPSDNLFDDLVELIKNKFGFVFQIIEIGDFLLNFDFSDTPPDLSFDFSNYNGSSRFIQFLDGFKFELLDWSVINPYRGFIRGLISAITWYFFLKSLPKTLVNLINGQIGDENI